MTSDARLSQAAAEAYLLGFINYETLSRYRPTTRTHDLRRFRSELIRQGWRPDGISTIHVGGTNGKGTVSTLLERLLRAGGLRTGLYTSPHLRSMRERIQIDGKPLSSLCFRDGVSRLADRAPKAAAGFRTTFEHLTALGFLSFQEANLDVAVIEVGLGGRLDATNVVPPGRAVLTPISIDHRQILGDTVARIAADKAHILKRGGSAFLLPQSPSARTVLLSRCRRESLEPVWTGEQVQVRIVERLPAGTVLHVCGREDYGRIRTGLLGSHQTDNVAGAVSVMESVLPAEMRARAVKRGLAGARVPGRLDLRPSTLGTMLLDGGHNPAAGRAVARAIRDHFPGARVEAVIAMARDKDHHGFLRALAPQVSRFHFTTTESPRAASPQLLRDRAPEGGRIHPDIEAALQSAARPGADLILVAGSFLLVGEVMRRLDRER